MPEPKTERHQYPSSIKDKFIGAVLTGTTVAKAARVFHIHDSAARYIWKKYKTTGSTENLPRSGCPHKLDNTVERHIIRIARRERRTPFTNIGNQLPSPVSGSTVRRVLRNAGYFRRVARKVPYLKKVHKRARLTWAHLYCDFTPRHWRKIMWTDECYIYLGDNHGRVYITRCADEKYLDECLVATFKQSPVRVMVWGCVMEGQKGPLVVLEYPGGKGGGMNTARYCEQVLEGALRGFYREMRTERGQVIFQQDNAPAHTSKLTKRWLTHHGITQLYHPPNSPDLSPIEPIWHELKQIIRRRPHHPTSVEELRLAVIEAWEQIPIECVNKHISEMPDRVAALLEARGSHIPF
ncbi:unnamed protein product [Cyclocybe aegerita]|uniref:Transposase n=1 Tax=Cyclocybe aegerita TaxID=1973307 RepID=A0A8S0WTJ5_CYCAE|nr:unnamed protein product [Cyclocybe aegerita]